MNSFLFLPIVLISWYGSKKAGVFLAFISTIAWAFSIKFITTYNMDVWPYIFSVLSHLCAYSLLAIIITNFRSVHRVEVIAADTDNLTGVLSPRSFYVELTNEVHRSQRYGNIFSLAYIDIDNFKEINDTLGHEMGDKLLIEVAKSLKTSLRATDKVARLGGDEFLSLLPETNSEDAKKTFAKVSNKLSKKMAVGKWHVSFSVGVVTFESPPEDIHSAVKIADDLMYSVKKDKKDDIEYKVWRRKGDFFPQKKSKIN